ncbi:MAG: hypothetical protein KDD58_02125 [Bdellovibrionales bacterium]|nr:hypothetical protein [Bdellovibrionales bacterium]
MYRLGVSFALDFRDLRSKGEDMCFRLLLTGLFFLFSMTMPSHAEYPQNTPFDYSSLIKKNKPVLAIDALIPVINSYKNLFGSENVCQSCTSTSALIQLQANMYTLILDEVNNLAQNLKIHIDQTEVKDIDARHEVKVSLNYLMNPSSELYEDAADMRSYLVSNSVNATLLIVHLSRIKNFLEKFHKENKHISDNLVLQMLRIRNLAKLTQLETFLNSKSFDPLSLQALKNKVFNLTKSFSKIRNSSRVTKALIGSHSIYSDAAQGISNYLDLVYKLRNHYPEKNKDELSNFQFLKELSKLSKKHIILLEGDLILLSNTCQINL